MLCKLGPLAEGHNHADLLQIVVSSGKQHFLVDSGTYTYNGDKRWRDFFRSTHAHNTIAVDGQSQITPHRTFKWLGKVSPKVHSIISTTDYDYLWAEHDGYARLDPPVVHRRGILFAKPAYWLLVDELVGTGEHQIESFFHFPPASQYRQDDDALTLFSGGEEVFRVLPLSVKGLESTVLEGKDEPIQGWYSASYGTKVPSPTLIYQGAVNLPMSMFFLLLPLNQSNFDFREANIERTAGQTNISVNCGFYVDHIRFESMEQPGFRRIPNCLGTTL